MDSAFLLVATRHADDVSAGALELVEEPRIDGLGFEPADHVQWRADSGTMALGAWQGTTWPWSEAAWHVEDDQAVMVTGHAWWQGETRAQSRSGWAVDVADSARTEPLAETAGRLRGIFAIVRCSASGDVAAASDPLGFRCLYYGESADVAVVSSRAELAAKALAGTGTPAQDALGACWLPYTTYRIGDTTGYDGVRVVPPGGVVEIGPDRRLRITRNAPWMPDPRTGLSTADLVEVARDDIAASLRAVLELPAERHVIGLTGGKDSRLILAVALWAGLAHHFDYETMGPPDLADVRVASELAELLGLRHTVSFVGLGSERPYADRIRDFVAATGGMLNIWDMAQPSTATDEVRVVGLCGEALRTFRRITKSMRSTDDLIQLFRPQDLGRLRLLRPEVAARLHRMLLDVLLDDPSGRAEPPDLFDALYIRNRLRFSRTGPQEELPGQVRTMPLYSLAAIRAAFALGGAARQAELLHREIISRCSPQLASHPFAGPGWSPADDPLRHGRTEARRPEGRVAARSQSVKAEPLMARLQRTAFDDRKHAFLPAVEDRTNPAWELIDRKAAVAALEQFPSLTPRERRELFGAVTAALWLSNATDVALC